MQISGTVRWILVSLSASAIGSLAFENHDPLDLRALGSAFYPEEDLTFRGFGPDGPEESYAREPSVEHDEFAVRGMDAFQYEVFARLTDLQDLDEPFARDFEDEEALFSRAKGGNFALSGLGGDDGLEEMVRHEIDEEEAVENRASSPHSSSSTSPPTRPKPVELAPVDCHAVTQYLHTYHKNKASYKRWRQKLEISKRAGVPAAVKLCQTKLEERAEYSKRLLWALLLQGREVKHHH